MHWINRISDRVLGRWGGASCWKNQLTTRQSEVEEGILGQGEQRSHRQFRGCRPGPASHAQVWKLFCPFLPRPRYRRILKGWTLLVVGSGPASICKSMESRPYVTYLGWIRISTLLLLIEPRVIMELRILTPIQSDHVAVPVEWEVPVAAPLTRLATSPLKRALEFFKYIFFPAGILSIPIQALSLFVQGSSLNSEGSSFVGEIPTKVQRRMIPQVLLGPRPASPILSLCH